MAKEYKSVEDIIKAAYLEGYGQGAMEYAPMEVVRCFISELAGEMEPTVILQAEEDFKESHAKALSNYISKLGES